MTDPAVSGTPRAASNAAEPPAVELIGITKTFGSVVACDNVDLALHAGSFHGILGENGAGKSTLMNILIGLVQPDAGEIRFGGQRTTIADPIAATELGIGMVHQHLSLVEALTVWENVALGDRGALRPAEVRDRVGDLASHYGLAVDPDWVVADLPAGLRQRVEIIKCLRRDPTILIFDEPTSMLTPAESEQLFVALRRVVETERRAVALVSHKLDEVRRAADDITIMRGGAVIERGRAADMSNADLARAMLGRDLPPRTRSVSQPTTQPNGAALSIQRASARNRDQRALLDKLDLDVAAGTIVGVAGVEGNGQRALGDVLSSLLRLDHGSISVDGVEVPTGQPGAMAAAGVAVIPEDRHDSALVLDMTVAENLFLADPERVARRGILDRKQMAAAASALIERFGIRCDGPDAPMWTLSGGNQQRVVLARELSHDPRVLVAAQPTRGLDVGAVVYMAEQLRLAAADGVAVLLISTELDEILDLADEIVVLHQGSVGASMQRSDVDADRLGQMLGGSLDGSLDEALDS